MKRHIVFLDRATIGPGVTVPAPCFDHEWINFNKTTAAETYARAYSADIVVTNKVVFDRELLLRLPQLQHIAIAATGTNCVDLSAARKQGISVSHVPSYAVTSVTEHTMAMILSLRRQLVTYYEDVRRGQWQAADQFCFFNDPIRDISSTTLGIVGTGAIAESVGSAAQAFGMRVIYHSVSGRREFKSNTLVDLETLLSQSDIVSLHCPLTEKTNALINQERLSLMKDDALLINTSRGHVVDLEALKEALLKKQLAGAGIDVAPEEPPKSDAAIMQLNQMPNCIVTPHTAWASIEAMQVLANQITRNLEAFQAEDPINIVN